MKKITFFLLFLFALNSFAQKVPTLKIMTENYPPFNMKENGKLSGIAVDTFDEMLKRVGSKQTKKDIELLSWSRAYHLIQNRPNTVLFSTSRTKERENLFKWVGPFEYAVNGLIAKKGSNIKIDSIDDLKKYKIGTVLNDIAEIALLSEGVSKENIQSVSGENAIIKSIRKLDKKRIDLFAYAVNVAKWDMKTNNIPFRDYEVVYEIKKYGQYFAFHKDTPDSVIKMFQNALNEMKLDGSLEEIILKY